LTQVRSLHLDTANTWRGGQSQALLTMRGLQALGHEVILACPADGQLARRAGDALRQIEFAPRSEFDVRAAWQLTKALGELKPDVVHAHDARAVSLAAMALEMQSPDPRPLVVAARRVDFHLKRHAFSKWKYRHVDVFIAASELIATMLRDDGIEAARIAVVHDGVDLDAIDAQPQVDVRASSRVPHGAPLIGNVAALAEHKGQQYLVQAMARLVLSMPDARLVIVGEGELRPALERQIRDAGLDRHIVLAGFRPDAIGWIKGFDVFAMSSVTEGLGSVVLEAMACSRPVVATRAGGIPEAVTDGETGLLVPPRDPEALAAALLQVLRDRPAATQMAEAARQRISRSFSVLELVTRTMGVYSRGNRVS
jgi:glycosyltransferase involved in cell wall biosynthesis